MLSRAPSAPRSGFALDSMICSEVFAAIAIDGAPRSANVLIEISEFR
jgi:hypothetical protein